VGQHTIFENDSFAENGSVASSMHHQRKLMMSNAHSQIEEDIPEEADEGPDE
jgi:hypothetical protein